MVHLVYNVTMKENVLARTMFQGINVTKLILDGGIFQIPKVF